MPSNLLATAGRPAPSFRPNRVVIDHDAISWNTKIVQRLVGSDNSVFAALKANAYGHDTVVAARAALAGGARGLTVGDLGEALQLRSEGIRAPIVVYPGVTWDRETLALAGEMALFVTLTDMAQVGAVAAATPAEVDVLLK